MKYAFLLVTVLIGGSAWAQSTLSPSFVPSTPVLTPSTPVLTPSSPAIPDPSTLGSGLALTSTGTSTLTLSSNFTITDLSTLLLNLQTNLAQVLPLLGAFNDNFDFVPLTPSGAVQVLPVTPATQTNTFGLVPLPGGGLSPNGFGALPVTRTTLRQLLVVQSDLSRLLPLLASLNGNTNAPTTLGSTNGP